MYSSNFCVHGQALDKCYDKFCPVFSEMTSLDVTLTGSGWRVLPVILNASPNLESLLVHKVSN